MPYGAEVEGYDKWLEENAPRGQRMSDEELKKHKKLKPEITFELIQRKCEKVIEELNSLDELTNRNPSFEPLREGISICKEAINYCLVWEKRVYRNGRISYYNRNTRQETSEPPLPNKWEIRRDERSKNIYYVDHNKERTGWDRPVWIFKNQMKSCPWTPTSPQFMRAGLAPEHVTCSPSYTESNSESSEPTSARFLHMRRLLLT
jgi:hypothetical protein